MNDIRNILKASKAKVRQIKKQINGVLEGVFDDETDSHNMNLLCSETRVWLARKESQLEEVIAIQEALARLVAAEDNEVTLAVTHPKRLQGM